jgi:acetyl esterase/lipase
VISTLLVRVLARLAPQRWCPPALSLRLFRASSAPGTAAYAEAVRTHLPPATWTTTAVAIPGGLIDLVIPDGPGPHPLVVWVHGGGWHFGDRSYPLPYLEMLASRGFAGASLDYPLAPGARYPAAPRQVNEALRYLVEQAADDRIDPHRIVLAGDSAGAQLAAEVAALITNPAYAASTTLIPALGPEQLRGALLFCGIYDPPALVDADRMFSAVLGSAMWSLTGTREWWSSEACRLMTVVDHVTAQFPPTLLAAGSHDPLTRRQHPSMAARLREHGVLLEEFCPGDDARPINHEFQFWLDTPEAAEALERSIAFLSRVFSEG